METIKADFAIKTEGNKIAAIGKSVIIQPVIRWDGKGIKWFDDSKLIRKSHEGK